MSVRAVAVVAVAWLAVPVVALADDCSDWTLGELPSCALLAILAPPLLTAFAILAVANWLRGPSSPPPRPTTPGFPRQFNTWQEFNEWAEETGYEGPPPADLVPGGEPPVNPPSWDPPAAPPPPPPPAQSSAYAAGGGAKHY